MTRQKWVLKTNHKEMKTWYLVGYGGGYSLNDLAYIQVYKTHNMNPPWRTTLHVNGKFVEDKLSKTKSQAIIFAKKYMRTH